MDDIVVYGNRGVFKVMNVGTLSISVADKHKQYYTLCPVYRQETVLYVPVENQKIIMRAVVSREEAEKLVAEIPEIETAWIANEREREAQYKAALKSCDCRELIKIIKTLYQRKKTRMKVGKKATAVDERYFRQAEEQLYEELAYSLGIGKEKVQSYIVESIGQKDGKSEKVLN